MDNSLLLKFSSPDERNYLGSLEGTITEYTKKARNDVVAPILQAHVIHIIIFQKRRIIQDGERSCVVQSELARIQHFMLKTFPQTAAQYIHSELGHTVHVAGEALEVSKCAAVAHYTILFNRTLNGTCFRHFPVILPGNEVRFLQVLDKQLVEDGVNLL